MFKVNRSLINRFIINLNKNSSSKRYFGSHHDSHAHATGPYDKPHKSEYPEEAHFPGTEPGAKWEGWEFITGTVFVTCAIILYFGPSIVEHPDIKVEIELLNCVL